MKLCTRWVFLSSCASGSTLCLSLFTNKSVRIACLSHRNVAKLSVCKAVWLKRLFPIKTGSKHLIKLDNVQIPDGHQWPVSIMVIDSKNWGRNFIRAETCFYFLVCLKFGYWAVNRCFFWSLSSYLAYSCTNKLFNGKLVCGFRKIGDSLWLLAARVVLQKIEASVPCWHPKVPGVLAGAGRL